MNKETGKFLDKIEIEEMVFELSELSDDSLWIKTITIEEDIPYIDECLVWHPMGGYTTAYTRMPKSVKKEIVRHLYGSNHKFARLPEI